MSKNTEAGWTQHSSSSLLSATLCSYLLSSSFTTQLFRSFPLSGAVKPAIDHLPNWGGEGSSVSCSNTEAAWCTSEMCKCMTGEDGLIKLLSLSFFFLIAQLNTALAALYYHLFRSLYYYSFSNCFWHLEDCWYFKSAKDTESYLPQEVSWTNA